MNILMMHPHDIYHDLEPWTVRITYLARELVERGHQIKLVYHNFEPNRNSRDGGNNEQFPFETIPYNRIGPGLSQRCFKIKALAAWADIIHFQKCTFYVAIPAIFAAYSHNRPIHYDWDDWEQKIYEQSAQNRIGSWIFFQQMERWLPNLVDTISVASNGIKQLTQRLNFPDDRVYYIPVGADLTAFSPAVNGKSVRQRYGWDKKLVLYHGQISGTNYVYLFIKAASRVLSIRNDVSFVVVGGGDRLPEARLLAQKEGLKERLTFTGEVSHNDIPLFIAAADIAVASFDDNSQSRCKSPLKVVEYLASGKPIVASKLPEVSQMLGEAGILVDPGDPEVIAEAAMKLLDDNDLRRNLGIKARKRSELIYNWEKSTDTLLRAYEKAFTARYGLT